MNVVTRARAGKNQQEVLKAGLASTGQNNHTCLAGQVLTDSRSLRLLSPAPEGSKT